MAVLNMADDLHSRARQMRQKLHESARFVATDVDRDLVITEHRLALWAAQLRGNLHALKDGIQSLSRVIGVTPELLWSQGFQLCGVLLSCIRSLLQKHIGCISTAPTEHAVKIGC
jgi:hypothetical protein